ncbi:helix-turn-helix domain-containing protein [Streptomyces solisilvae]|uniref:helix-turn-helix domain-containing protein n=1 Tax=Streptomyces malaysiensis TaxID=92644 RepID=UPI0036BB55FA
MSLDPILWAMKDAPTADINEWGALLCLAEAADEDGCNAFPSVKTIASYAKISTRTVQRVLGALEERRLIAEGDQRAAHYIPEYRRPTVYDLLIPYDWFRDIDRTNSFRLRLGRAALTPQDRPPIPPAPPKKARADKGKRKPKKAPDDAPAEGEAEGRLVVTPVENAPSKGGRQEVTPVENQQKGATTSHPVTDSPEWGDYKSGEGRLEVTQPSPTTRTTDPPRPSVGSTRQAGAEGEEREDGYDVGTRVQKTHARAVEQTPGVDLLLGLGHERPEMLLTGKVLADQGRMADALLLGGWTRDHILTALLRPLPPQTRSVGAVISRRLRDLAATPVPRPSQMPPPRDPEAREGFWQEYEDTKQTNTWTPDPWDARQGLDTFCKTTPWAECRECRDPIFTKTGTDTCAKCLKWSKCPLCTKYVPPHGQCETCDLVPEAIQFELCEKHGDRYIKGTACFECSEPS